MRPRVLTHDDVHLIRTSGLSDAHWQRTLGVTRTCVQKARVGITWPLHPTPPDSAPRKIGRGRRETNSPPQMSEQERQISRALAQWGRVA